MMMIEYLCYAVAVLLSFLFSFIFTASLSLLFHFFTASLSRLDCTPVHALVTFFHFFCFFSLFVVFFLFFCVSQRRCRFAFFLFVVFSSSSVFLSLFLCLSQDALATLASMSPFCSRLCAAEIPLLSLAFASSPRSFHCVSSNSASIQHRQKQRKSRSRFSSSSWLCFFISSFFFFFGRCCNASRIICFAAFRL